jgi:hypothetical protein
MENKYSCLRIHQSSKYLLLEGVNPEIRFRMDFNSPTIHYGNLSKFYGYFFRSYEQSYQRADIRSDSSMLVAQKNRLCKGDDRPPYKADISTNSRVVAET